MHNTAITLSLLAILISAFSVVYATKDITSILIYSTFSLLGLLIYIKRFKRTQKKLDGEREILKKEYDELFKYHFDYATNKG